MNGSVIQGSQEAKEILRKFRESRCQYWYTSTERCMNPFTHHRQGFRTCNTHKTKDLRKFKLDPDQGWVVVKDKGRVTVQMRKAS